MTLLFPARALGADPVDHAQPSGNGSDDIVPFTSLKRQNGIVTPKADFSLDSVLQEILCMPKVTGAAIALDTGDYVQCKGSRGDSAPPAGTRCDPGTGLTGLCLSKGEVQVCNNTDDDSRVDRQACQYLGVRSVLVVPIRRGSTVIGILEALSSQANVFDEQKVRCVTNLAEQVGSSAPRSSSTLGRTRHNRGIRDVQDQHKGASSPPVKETLPSAFDLQEVLQAVYVVQQHNCAAFLADSPATAHSEIDRENVHSTKPPEARECAGPVDQPCASVPPYSFNLGQEAQTESPSYRSLVLAAIFLAVLFGSYYLLHFEKKSRQTVNISGTAPGRDPLPAANLGQTGTQVASESSATQYELAVPDGDTKEAPQSYATSMASFAEAAKMGNADAGWELGLGYLKGVGVVKDETKAVEWFKRAANLGDVRAQTALSDFYFRGVGVRRDYVRAYTWASIAAGGRETEDKRLKAIKQRMTTAQLENANGRTAAWFARKPKR